MKRRDFLGAVAAVPAATALLGLTSNVENPNGLPIVQFEPRPNSSQLEISNLDELLVGISWTYRTDASLLYRLKGSERLMQQRTVKVWVNEPIKWTESTKCSSGFGSYEAVSMCRGEMLLVCERFWIGQKEAARSSGVGEFSKQHVGLCLSENTNKQSLCRVSSPGFAQIYDA